MILEFIETAKGNEILDQLKSEGWKTKSQYSPLAFDKGIDYDRYELVLKDKAIVFEWTNWFEWELTGTEEILGEIKQRFLSPNYLEGT